MTGSDGQALAASVFAPQMEAIADVLIAPATAVRRTYYEPFAAYLAERGMRALTLDYRGIGDSRPRRLRGFAADLEAWARDLDVAAAWLAESRRPLLYVGHSFGGQALGLLEHRRRVAA
ncbi:MAG TPA: alpha/beta fold hydrolase, partial [Thermoanaerobaculia bacterium]|nr:alpha/beta fold hydrolase [Thermoanaerobaculia bacterium]